MWTRKELKEKGKASFKRNYWKAVLVALICSVIAGGFSGGGAYTGNYSNLFSDHKIEEDNGKGSGLIGEIEETKKELSEDMEDAREDIDEAVEEAEEAAEDGEGVIVNVESPEDIEKLGEAVKNEIPAGVIVVAVLIGIIVFVIVMAIAMALSAFLLNPIDTGCHRFFVKNLDEPAEIAKNVLFVFDHNYLNVVKTLFFRDLYLFFWTMLFIIPGIVKAYEYRMIPYLLAEHPEMDSKAAFAKSKEMMSGNKWKAFVLDLSFLGWELLSLLTCGILSIFYVTPYEHATGAALYDALKDKDEYVAIETEAVNEL